MAWLPQRTRRWYSGAPALASGLLSARCCIALLNCEIAGYAKEISACAPEGLLRRKRPSWEMEMAAKNLEEALRDAGNVVELLRNQQTGPNVYPGVPAEYTNWREEVRAWQQTCVLFNQSYHMVDLAVEGPDAFAMLNHLGVNSFNGFTVDKAKQFVPCTPDGHVIGDVILFYLGENQFNLVGRAPVIEWVEYHAATGDWNVKVERDERTVARKDPSRRKSYRFQVQGPNAMKVIERATGRTPPDLKFFNMTHMTIGGKQVRALRHGMAGQPGFELFGPWDDGEAVRQALIEAGREFGLRLRSIRARPCGRFANGCRPTAMRPRRRSAEASSPTISRIIISRPGTSAMARSSSSITTSSAGRRSRRWPPVRIARR
jgi:syringate O-demethylase